MHSISMNYGKSAPWRYGRSSVGTASTVSVATVLSQPGLYQISYHAIIDYLRKSKEVRFLSFDDLSDTDLVTTDTQHDWQLFDKLKEHLNHNEQTLLDYYINDEPYSTISHAEGITETAARKRMSRLINKLKMLVHK